MAYRYFFATLSLILAGVSVAQDKCLSSTITERWLEQHGQHVDLAAEATALEQGNIRGGGLLTIPVAVHVVWNTTAENVSNTVIQNIIAQMNADYPSHEC
jgi:RsiW-degrading membrane proteinase PrsW (M82 family)